MELAIGSKLGANEPRFGSAEILATFTCVNQIRICFAQKSP
jgi:hypothetical protein